MEHLSAARSKRLSFPDSHAAVVLLALSITTGSVAHASWSNDPAHPLILSDAADEQVQPKIVPRGDGGFYVSWFDNSTGGYDVRLQRLDIDGNEMWAHDGVLVANRGLSSTTDYGLAVDAAGNALLAFNDDSQPTERIVAAKYDASGAPLWGTPGIAVSTFSGFLASPRIAATSDGEVVVGWTQGDSALDVVVQRLDANGVKQWGTDGIVLAHSGDNFLLSDLRATATGGAVIASWVRYVTFLGDKHLWAQKLDGDGAALWAAGHVRVFDLAGGSLQFGNFPGFELDGSGGALFSWYTTTPALQVRAQRIVSAGTESFPHNGVELSTDATRSRVDPAACFDTASGEVTAFWVETNALQNQFGLYGQRLGSTGTRLWGESGEELVALDPRQVTQVRAICEVDGPTLRPEAAGTARDSFAIWSRSEAFDDDPIYAARIDPLGGLFWTPGIRTVKSETSGTSRLAAGWSIDGFAALVWSDGATDGDIEIQNLRLDGTLGEAVFVDGFEAGNPEAWSSHSP